MDGLEIKVNISLQFTAEQWQLYEGQEEAAQQLNVKLMELVNSGARRTRVAIDMQAYMRELSDSGAADTGPYELLQWILDQIYGTDYEWD